jgi:hypothetical protein
MTLSGRALGDTHRRGTLVCAPGGSNNRYLNRPAIGVKRGAALAIDAIRG